MACYRPRQAFQGRPGSPVFFRFTGEVEVPADGHAGRRIYIPCGKCLGCLSGKATDWAARCEIEARRWEQNCFLTLTYDDAHLPKGGQLWPAHHVAFVKALRKAANAKTGSVLGDRDDDGVHRIRFFMCGEYGTKRGRPHYHYLLFNCGFADAQLREDSLKLRESGTVRSLWRYGLHAIGELTGASANYIAQYTLAKQRQVFVNRREPFLRMSLKPGIGMTMVDENGADLQHGYLVRDGQKRRIPKGFVDRAKRQWPGLAQSIEVAKAMGSLELDDEPALERLAAEEVIHTQAKAMGERHTAE